MNIKRFLLAAVSLFIFIYVYEYAVHVHLLTGLYLQTPNIWRADLASYAPFNYVIMALLAIWNSFIFTRFYPSGGVKNGLLFGFYVGILAAIQAAGAYYYLPITFSLTLAWFIAMFIECLIGGALIGLVYKRA